MSQNSKRLHNQEFLVVGTERIWIEALALLFKASHITSLDYTHKRYEHSAFNWFHVNEFLNLLVQKNKFIEQFANAASYSSIEHSGLGRYGEALNPIGDIEAVQMVKCLLRPNGLFFLGLPTSKDNTSYLEFNARRVYGHERLEILLNGWTVVKQLKNLGDTFDDTLFILEKKSVC